MGSQNQAALQDPVATAQGSDTDSEKTGLSSERGARDVQTDKFSAESLALLRSLVFSCAPILRELDN